MPMNYEEGCGDATRPGRLFLGMMIFSFNFCFVELDLELNRSVWSLCEIVFPNRR